MANIEIRPEDLDENAMDVAAEHDDTPSFPALTPQQTNVRPALQS